MAVAPKVAIPLAAGVEACGPVQLEQLLEVPLFQGLSAKAAKKLCALLVSREFKAPTRLFNAGDLGDAMYLIERGRVRITVTDADGREVTLTEMHEGEFFGEMALIDGHERSAGATVLEDTRLAILSREDFLAFIGSDPQVMLAMLSEMARRLRRTDNLLRHRVARNANTEDAAHTTQADRAADLIAQFGGSWSFIGACIALIIFWIALNSYILMKGFDPAPYQMLNLVLAVVAGLQAPIIMMSQNRQSKKDRLRSDLDYEVNLKNELLLTEIRTLLLERRRGQAEKSALFEGR
ncbi:MAG: DUF1003 domain-containing protein [Verrucomicrobiota bacterium]|nr:DUF1003 domain-containing protein [Verrucomicrobiota bacterium]